MFAAASTASAIEAAAAEWTMKGNGPVTVHAAATSTLARQIEFGAHADVFVSAHPAWTDRLAMSGHVAAETIVTLASNALVVAVREDDAAARPYPACLDGRVAMGDPDHVPIGQYARQALETAGLWTRVADRQIAAFDAAAAAALVRRGECEAGVLYATQIGPGLRVAHRFPPGVHESIEIRAAATGPSPSLRALDLLDWLAGESGQRHLQQAGFLPGEVR